MISCRQNEITCSRLLSGNALYNDDAIFTLVEIIRLEKPNNDELYKIEMG